MGYQRIIALDLGKFKSVACVMQVVDRSTAFETIQTTPQTKRKPDAGITLWPRRAVLTAKATPKV